MMLASRGFAFTSAAAASAGSHEGCDCVVVPGTPETRVEGYDHEGMAERWQQCVECVDGEWLTRQARAEWDAMGEAERAKWAGKTDRKTREAIESLGEERSKELGLGEAASEEAAFKRYRAHRLAREAMKEVERRDPAWAFNGASPSVTFETRELERDVLKLRPHEYESALRLTGHGVRADFQVDEKKYLDAATGIMLVRGLPDFASGLELKTLLGASTYNTVNGYIKNSKKKEGCAAVVFDNSQNGSLEDDALAGLILRSRSFSRGAIYLLGHGDVYRRIR